MKKIAILVVVLFHFSMNAKANNIYDIVDIGSLGGNRLSGERINELGQITGSSNTFGDLSVHAFLTNSHNIVDIGGAAEGMSFGRGVNNRGQVAGEYYIVSGALNGFYTNSNGGFVGLGGSYSSAMDINDYGVVTGFYAFSTSVNHAFYAQNGTIIDLGTLGGQRSTGVAINNSGQVTGMSYLSGDNQWHAFVTNNNQMQDLGTLNGFIDSSGMDINELGQVTGYSFNGSSTHAILTVNGVMIDLGSMGYQNSIGSGLNDLGQVVGKAYGWDNNGNIIERAFVYTNGNMIDLNTLVAISGWTLNYASDINNRGQIVAGGINSLGQRHVFLLTPFAVPLPSAVWLFGLSIIGLVLMKSKKLDRMS